MLLRDLRHASHFTKPYGRFIIATVLRNRSILGLIAAELVSLTGSSMTFVALPWFVLVTTGSTAKLGWVMAAQLIPVGLLGIPAGSLISRLGAKRAMLVSDAARGPLMVVLPVLHWTGHLSFPAILAVAFAVGCFTAPYFSSSRLVIPEVVGDDERRVAEVNAVVGGANTSTLIVGPVLAGILIAATNPSVVLVVDAATYALSFLTIATVVRAGKRVDASEESKGLLAGLRYLMRDPLLGPLLVVACVLNLVVEGLIVGINALAYFQYSSAHVAGFLFGAFGVGSLLGAVLAQQLVSRVDLLRLAAIAIVTMPLPLWALAVKMPWGAALVVLGAFSLGGPLVNAPVLGILTTKPPEALRPKVMTAVMTMATGAGPLGFLAAGEALRVMSLQTLFVVIATLLTVISVAFAAVLRRGSEPDQLEVGLA
jgi:MFS family permease